MQVRGREEDVLVEERAAGPDGRLVGAHPAASLHAEGDGARSQTEVLALSRAALLEHFATQPGRRLRRHRATSRQSSGQRLQVFQAMWLREMQRVVESRRA